MQPGRHSVPDVNLRDDNNCTALHLALLKGERPDQTFPFPETNKTVGRRLWEGWETPWLGKENM